MQKRFLLDTMKSLHKQFKKENPETKCSYFYFTKNRPFFVVKPSADARETCLCKTHINFAYKTQALKKQGIIQTDNLCDVINASVCDNQSKNCMYNSCNACQNKTLTYNENKIKGVIKYSQWIRKEEVYEKDGKKMKTIKNVKEELSDRIANFLKSYEKDLVQFKKHVFNIKVQFHNFRVCLNKLQPNEAAIVVDFSENYNCKYNEEVQSHHFGGSRKQISLHTVMVYTHDPDKQYKPQSFCTISSSTCHQPAAIWAHLDPIIQFIRSEHRSVDTVHFFSDGPSTQYRQKQNFYLLCKKIFDYGFAASTWSFFEAGHGKGPADGVGGFLKRTADQVVANGKDIANVDDFMKHLNNASKIKLYLIKEEDISAIQDNLPKVIPRLVGTMKVHQIFTDNEHYLKYRSLSCFCASFKRGFCDCYNPQIYKINTNEPVASEENIVPLYPDLSSDDEVPLSSLRVLKDIQNTLPRTSFYQSVYGNYPSSDDEDTQDSSANKENFAISKNDSFIDGTNEAQPSSSYKDCSSKQVSVDDFLHVFVYSDNLKKKRYSYVCKALTPVEEDGEVKVVFLRVAGKKDARLFRLDERDINYVDSEDIIKILPNPTVVKKGLRVYYQFDVSIDVFEK
ncbi:uncharacterized protein LOC125238480 [Leguminivora glycinivorella]|uniref:uncharacterized protein LOC125238480 n=1 Tax=Leguminivora glycinivorella TaxID=1035111 RepID=UPI00201083C4|nr:uncharacterized protein LOC125238480 [Leguminivora glycinivorella]